MCKFYLCDSWRWILAGKMLLINRRECFHINTNHPFNVLHKLSKNFQTIIFFSFNLTTIKSIFGPVKPQPLYRNLATNKNTTIKGHYYGISNTIGKKYKDDVCSVTWNCMEKNWWGYFDAIVAENCFMEKGVQ